LPDDDEAEQERTEGTEESGNPFRDRNMRDRNVIATKVLGENAPPKCQ
jgi:hypothetical protein